MHSHSSCGSSRRSGKQPESEKDRDVGGIWILWNVEELEVEEMRGECCERPAQIRTEHSDGFSENETVQRDRFGEIRANRYRCDGSAKVMQTRVTGAAKNRADQRNGSSQNCDGFGKGELTCKVCRSLSTAISGESERDKECKWSQTVLRIDVDPE